MRATAEKVAQAEEVRINLNGELDAANGKASAVSKEVRNRP